MVCIRIIYETNSSTKALAYLLVVIFVPLIGMMFYFSFGVNYRKRILYTKKLIDDDKIWTKIKTDISGKGALRIRGKAELGHDDPVFERRGRRLVGRGGGRQDHDPFHPGRPKQSLDRDPVPEVGRIEGAPEDGGDLLPARGARCHALSRSG